MAHHCTKHVLSLVYFAVAVNELLAFACIVAFAGFLCDHTDFVHDWLVLFLAAFAGVLRTCICVVGWHVCGVMLWVPGTKFEHVLNGTCFLLTGATSHAVTWALYYERTSWPDYYVAQISAYLPSIVAVGGNIMFSCQWSFFRVLEWRYYPRWDRDRAARAAASSTPRRDAAAIAAPAQRSLAYRAARPQVSSYVLDASAPLAGSTCIICMGDIEAGCLVGRLPCEHMFHDDCIRKWLKHGYLCPMRCARGEADSVPASENVPVVVGRAADLEPSPHPSADV